MMKWRALLVAGLVVVTASCGANPSPTLTPSSAPASATPAPTSTVAPATATEVASPTPAQQVAATLETTATTTVTAAKDSNQANPQDLAPTTRSIWNTAVGLDQMQGACPKGSMLPVYGLVQITPQGDQLNWKNQEPKPYTFSKVQTNEYQYAGPSAINDGTLTMTLKFTSDKTLEMLRQFVATADPGCLHTHVYTGTFQWNK
jgi:hypothetical protein